MATTHPEIALEMNQEKSGLLASEINAGNHNNVWWTCSNCRAEWRASPINRSRLSSGCPRCAKPGYDASSNGYLYLLRKESEGLQQFGITNSPINRTGRHKKNGWETLEVRGPMDGHLTQQWERAILRMLKAKGADLSNSKIAGKFDGYSEAWSKSTFPVKSIKELMRLTEEFEEGK
jgi:hypothetical protein